MKRINYIIFLLLLSTLYVHAQPPYVRKNTLVNNNPCGLNIDSSYYWMYDYGVKFQPPPFVSLSRVHYTYDGFSRTTKIEQDGKTRLFFFEDKQKGIKNDSFVRIYTPQNSSSVSEKYSPDSLLLRINYYSEDSLTAYTIFDYTNSGKDLLVQEYNYTVSNKIPTLDTFGYTKAILRNRVLVQYEYFIKDDHYESTYRRVFNTYGDTSITFSRDSTVDLWMENGIQKSDFYGALDSSVVIKKAIGGTSIVQTYQKHDFYFPNNPIQHSESKSLDTLFQDGSSITYWYSETTDSYQKGRKHEITQDGWIEHLYHNGRWIPSHKHEANYIDDQKNCLGSSYGYSWINNSWRLDGYTINYYGAQTNLGKKESPTCILPNPLSPYFELTCDALTATDLYTLSVYDMTGGLALQEDFKMNQTIDNLSALVKNQLYFFVITNSNGALVSKQKIYMAYN